MLYVLLRIHWSRAEARRAHVVDTIVEKNAALPPNRAVKTALSSTDTQRIDHLYRNVLLKVGEQADLKDLTFGRLPRFRVAFAGIEQASGQDFAHIKLELGGVAANCGSAVQELGENDFLVPRGAPGDEHCSIHYTCGKTDAVSFLQVKVAKLNKMLCQYLKWSSNRS